MKILQTPVRFYPAVGGVEKYVLDLSKQLVNDGHTVTVLCANEPASTVQKHHGITIKRLRTLFKVANTNITPMLFWKIMHEDFDIIHTHYPTPWSAEISLVCAWLKKRACIITYHNDVEKEGLIGFLSTVYNRTILQFLLSRVDKILVTQPGYASSSRYLTNFLKKIEVVPNGIAGLPKIEEKERSKRSILFVSVLDRHHRYKGLNFLIEAVAELAVQWCDVSLEIVGRGELVEDYQKQAAHLGVEQRVHFHGYVDDETLGQLYQSCTVFVLPSVDLHEGFGIVLLEAMSHGMPVITTSIVGISAEIQKHKAGYIVRPKNGHAIAEAVSQVFSDPQQASVMGQNGRNLVRQQYLWEDIAKRLEGIYQEFVS